MGNFQYCLGGGRKGALLGYSELDQTFSIKDFGELIVEQELN